MTTTPDPDAPAPAEDAAAPTSDAPCPLTVGPLPAAIRPGEILALDFRLRDPAAARALTGATVVVTDETPAPAAEGETPVVLPAELGRLAVTLDDFGDPTLGELLLAAPRRPGRHLWRARLERPDPPGEEAPAFPALDIPLEVAAHRPAVSVWGLAPVVARGETFRVQVGIKCPLGCPSAGWAFEIRDGGGQRRAAGAVGPEPWPGTEGIHHAEVALRAPEAEGSHAWQVVALAREAPCPHAEAVAALRLTVGPPAGHRLRILAVDAATRAPVPRAQVVAHPYRAATGADGLAELRLPRGRYRLAVARPPYFALQTEIEVAGDLDLEAEMQVDRAFGVEDAYA